MGHSSKDAVEDIPKEVIINMFKEVINMPKEVIINILEVVINEDKAIEQIPKEFTVEGDSKDVVKQSLMELMYKPVVAIMNKLVDFVEHKPKEVIMHNFRLDFEYKLEEAIKSSSEDVVEAAHCRMSLCY